MRRATADHAPALDDVPTPHRRAIPITAPQPQQERREPDRSGLNPEQILADVAELAADRKALDIVALDLRGMVGYADYFFICTGRSDRQAKAIHDGVHQGLKDRYRLLPGRVEGLTEAHWILMDYLDVVVHIFTPDTREHYRLEQLWGQAPRTELTLAVG